MSNNRRRTASQSGREGDDRVSVPAGRIPAGSGERVLAEFRDASTAVSRLYEVHTDTRQADALDLATVEDALTYVSSAVVLALDHENGTEHLYYRAGDGGSEWYSIMYYEGGRTHGPIALYRSDIPHRLAEYSLEVVKTDGSLFADRLDNLPAYGLDADEDGVRADA